MVANPGQHLAYISRERITNIEDFADSVWSVNPSAERAVLFVHGNSVDIVEASTRFAKVQKDYGLILGKEDSEKMPSAIFVGQSSGAIRGYAYDRESLRHDRKHLEEVIKALTKKNDRKLIIVAHSLGTDFVMETLLRIQLQDTKKKAVRKHVSGVILIAPDLSIEVFNSQIEDIKNLPSNFAVLTHTRDRVLQTSAFLRRNRNRLGLLGTQNEDDLIDALDLCEKGVTFVNMNKFSKGDLWNHTVPFSSKEAIKIFRQHINKKDFIDSWIKNKAADAIIALYNNRESDAAQKSGIDFDSLEQFEKSRQEKNAEFVLSAEEVPFDVVEGYLEQSDSLKASGLCKGGPFKDL